MNNKLSFPMKGFSMLEVLVALLVISVGLLGVATLQTKGQQFNYFSYVRTQSTYLAYDLMERIRTNVDAEKDAYKISVPVLPSGENSDPDHPKTKCEDAVCNSSDLANDDLLIWSYLVQNTLPEGSAEVEPLEPLGSGYKITLEWSQGEGEERKQQLPPWVIKL